MPQARRRLVRIKHTPFRDGVGFTHGFTHETPLSKLFFGELRIQTRQMNTVLYFITRAVCSSS